MAKSTHRGHCQACGALQMLPSGVLAKHGYKVDHGYFSGICAGSGEFPYELSCELIGAFVERAEAEKKALEQIIAGLRKTEPGDKAWFRVSLANPRGTGYGPVRRWRECTVTEEVKPFTVAGVADTYSIFTRDGDTYSHRAEENGKPKATPITAGYSDTLLTVRAAANNAYADWLGHEVESLARYITYQEQRIREWKIAPLLPVEHRDKLGFKPTPAPY